MKMLSTAPTITTSMVAVSDLQQQVPTTVVVQQPTTTTSMVATSVLLQHIPTTVVERLRPTMTFMVITSAPAAVGNVIEFVS